MRNKGEYKGRHLTFVIVILLLITIIPTKAQEGKTYGLEIVDDLLDKLKLKSKNLVINTAKGYSESTEDVSLSFSIITNVEIEQSGALTIVEALKLAPGVIVRYNTQGNYLVSIRGVSDLYSDINGNSGVFVAINGIPYNNLFSGGVDWEGLPVSIGEVDRIEIVRAPLASIYGGASFSGAINIVTKKSNYFTAGFDAGSPRMTVARISGNTSFGKKASIGGSGKIEDYYKSQDTYYVYNKSGYVLKDSLLFYQPDVEKTNTYTTKSRLAYCGGMSFNYSMTEKSSFGFYSNFSKSEKQSKYWPVDNVVQTMSGTTFGEVGMDVDINQLSIKANYRQGEYDIAKGYKGYQYDYSQLYGLVSYQFKVNDLSVVPFARYNQGTYEPKVDTLSLGFKSTEQTLSNLVGGLHAFYKIGYRIKVRGQFSYVQNMEVGGASFNYLMSCMLKLTDKMDLSVGYSSNTSSPNQVITTADESYMKSDGVHRVYSRADGLSLSKLQNAEIILSNKITDNLSVGLEGFYYSLKDGYKLGITINGQSEAITLENSKGLASSAGASAYATFNYNAFSLNSFYTYQKGLYKDNGKSTMPNLYGGFSAGISTFYGRVHFNTSMYYMGTYYNDGFELGGLPSLNASVSFKFLENFDLRLSARNMLHFGSDIAEVQYGDFVVPYFSLGVNFNL